MWLEELRDIKLQAEEATKKLESKSKQKEDSDMQQFQDKVNPWLHIYLNLKTNDTASGTIANARHFFLDGNIGRP